MKAPKSNPDMSSLQLSSSLSRVRLQRLSELGGATFLAGVAIAVCFGFLLTLPNLQGQGVVPFLTYFALAGVAYGWSVIRLPLDRPPLWVIWSFALLFRLILLFSSPTLSNDVFRYLWDGHLLNLGVNPYALPVNSPLIDPYHLPIRTQVDHGWMASPYLPAAQLFFTAVYRIAPGSVLAFQLAAIVFDLLTGWLIMDLLQRLELPRWGVLIYLWNPLVVVEFSHSAHVDALMIFLVMLTFWFLVRGRVTLSSLALATATLTKGLPVLVVPLVARRWGWRRVILYSASVFVGLALFAAGAGWGLTGPFDGRGLFGAIRIYLDQWNFNSGLYHWLEVGLTGYNTPGSVPVEAVESRLIQLARLISLGLLVVSMGITFWLAWKRDTPQHGNLTERNLTLLRLALFPLAAYLLTARTLHPWYVTLVLPLLPFLVVRRNGPPGLNPLVWSWLYFSVAVVASYITYLDPQNPREFALVRQIEYIPFYGLLLWGLLRHLNHAIRQRREH